MTCLLLKNPKTSILRICRRGTSIVLKTLFEAALCLKAPVRTHQPAAGPHLFMEMSASYPFAPNLFNVNAWNLRDSSAVNDMILFIQSFTDAIIHPNNGQDAPPDQASAFIELVADPNVSSVIQIAMPELWSNEGELLALQNPWIWALRSVTKPFVEGNIGYDEQTLSQQRMANTAAVVLTVLNVLQEQAGLERLYEIDAVKRVFATRLVRLMPH